MKYTYDTFNHRVSRTLDSDGNGHANEIEIEKYIYDGENVIFDFVDPDGVGSAPMVLKHRYLYGPAVDQILAQEDVTVSVTSPSRVLWFLGDDQNTTHDLVDNTGALVTGGHYEYGSFGDVTNTTTANTSLTRYLYTGRELDTATGEQYNRGRWYDSSTGRWLSEDPLGFKAGDSNLYRYVGNGPTNHADPRATDWTTTAPWWGALAGEAALLAEELAAAAAAAASSPAALCVAAGAAGYGVGYGIDQAGLNPFTAAVNAFYGSAFAAGAFDPNVQAQVDALLNQIADLEDKIDSIRNCKFGYGPHSVAGSEQELAELAKQLADLIAKNPPK